MTKPKSFVIIFGIGVLALLTVVSVLAADEVLSRYVISGGGGIGLTDGQNYKLHGTLGQPVAGMVAIPSGHRLCSGFWCGGELQEGYSLIHLPLVAYNYIPPHILEDAPNACQDAYAIEFAPHSYSDDFDTEGEADYYKFLATKDSTYLIETYDMKAENITTILILYDSNCQEIKRSTPKPDGKGASLTWNAPFNDWYHILVYEAQGIEGPDTYYVLSVQQNP